MISYDGVALPTNLNARIIEMATLDKDPTYMFRFWERLQRNPSNRSVTQLFSFLDHEGIPIDADGCFLAYKAIRQDWTDVHSGKVLNTVGSRPKMARNLISDDPNHACHHGYHVGAIKYAEDFGPNDRRIVIVRVDPAHVVCVPSDCSARKMRVEEYEVIGLNSGRTMPSTVIENDPVVDKVIKAHKREEAGKKPLKAAAGKSAWAVFNGYNEDGLAGCSTADLRSYAAHELGIVNASRGPGGKSGLITLILQTR